MEQKTGAMMRIDNSLDSLTWAQGCVKFIRFAKHDAIEIDINYLHKKGIEKITLNYTELVHGKYSSILDVVSSELKYREEMRHVDTDLMTMRKDF